MTSAWDSSHAPSRRWRSERVVDRAARRRARRGAVRRASRAAQHPRRRPRPRLGDRRADRRSRPRDGFDADAARPIGRPRAHRSPASSVSRRARDSLLVICDLESAAAFETNRTGLVVLHPHAGRGAGADRDPRLAARAEADALSRRRSARISRCSTSRRSPGRTTGWRSTSGSQATCSRWKISATGRTPRSRPTAGRWRCRSPTAVARRRARAPGGLDPGAGVGRRRPRLASTTRIALRRDGSLSPDPRRRLDGPRSGARAGP